MPMDLAIKPDTTLTVYNFEVNDLHNYYVGTQEVLVHNDCAALTRLEDLGISKSNLTALENSFRKSGVIKADRTKLYNKLKDELEAGNIEIADINRLITDLDNGSFSKKAKKYITTNTDLGSIKAWKIIQNWTNRQEVLDLLASLKLNNKVNNYNVVGTNGGANLNCKPLGNDYA